MLNDSYRVPPTSHGESMAVARPTSFSQAGTDRIASSPHKYLALPRRHVSAELRRHSRTVRDGRTKNPGGTCAVRPRCLNETSSASGMAGAGVDARETTHLWWPIHEERYHRAMKARDCAASLSPRHCQTHPKTLATKSRDNANSPCRLHQASFRLHHPKWWSPRIIVRAVPSRKYLVARE